MKIVVAIMGSFLYTDRQEVLKSLGLVCRRFFCAAWFARLSVAGVAACEATAEVVSALCDLTNAWRKKEVLHEDSGL